jgi:amino acid adenylation domain-containing protein
MSSGSLSETSFSPQIKRELLAQLIRQIASPAPESAGLSHGQSALWFTHQLAPQSWAYHVVFSARIRSEVDAPVLRQSLQFLLDRHGILKTTYAECDGVPTAHFHSEMPVDFAVTWIDAATWRDIREICLADVRQPFDLERGPILRARLYRRTQDDALFVLTIHHIAIDFWSLGILLQELRVVYAELRAEQPVSLPPCWVTYDNFVRQQTDMLARPEGDRLRAYWLQQLSGEPPVLALPLDRPRPIVQTYQGASHAFQLSSPLTQALHALAQREHVTLYMILLAALQILLHRYSGQDDIWVGSPMACRNRPSFRSLVGYCVNPVVMRANLSGNPTCRGFLAEVRRTVLNALQHANYPFPLLVKHLQPHRDASRLARFQVSLVLQTCVQAPELLPCFMPTGASPAAIEFGDLVLEPYPLPQQEGQFDLGFEMADFGSSIGGLLQYNTDLFDAATIARMAQHFTLLLEGLATHPAQPVKTLPLLTAAERQQLLGVRPGVKIDARPNRCLHHLFETQVERTPDAVAVRFEQDCLTYQALNHRANQLAWYLCQRGVGPEAHVGLFLERSLEMVIGVLGILKAGGAYLPIDPSCPIERLAFMLDDAQVEVLITQQHLQAAVAHHVVQTICLDRDWPTIARCRTDNPDSGVTAQNLAYVIYTSGSTGQPKGVMVEHQHVVRLFRATYDLYHFDAHDVWTLFHSIAFDFSVWELWGALLYGGRLVVVSHVVSRSAQALYELLQQERVTVLNQTPSAFRQLMAVDERAPDVRALALRLVVLGGEALALPSLAPWFERHGDERPQVVNMYGITETTVHVTYRPLHAADLKAGAGSVIGVPIADLHVYVLDKFLQPVPIGVTGELHVAGAGLARGYLNRPGLTAERFIAPPFSSVPGARLYRSGDLGRYLANGEIEYLGRTDQQVKLRGYRIELGEIETVLRQHPEVRDAVVVVRDAPSGHQQLVAYVVATRGVPTGSAGLLKHQAQPETQALVSSLRRFLQHKLPDYMVPAIFVMLDMIPLTPNGKIDRQALPLPELIRTASVDPFVLPQTPEETSLLPLWCHVLGLETMSTHENFFELGGHSLQAMQLVSQIAGELQRDVPVHALFLHPTISDLAPVLHTYPLIPAPARQVEPERMVNEPAMQPSSPFVTWVRSAILPGFATGEFAPVHAAALVYFPVSLVSLSGLPRDLLLRDWCHHRPCVASLLDTHWGRLALIVLPVWSDELYRHPDGLTAMALEGLEVAAQIGAQAVSLSGLLPSATDYGRALTAALNGRADQPRVSTGHAVTTSAIVFTLEKLLHEGGRHLAGERVGFLGLGSIGRTTLHLMLHVLPHPTEILLCDIYAKRHRLDALAQALRESTGFQGSIRIVTADPNVPEAFYEATLIVGATNVPDILDVARLQPGTLVVDDSAPHCFDAEYAVQRCLQQRDILMTEGGLVRLPHPLHEVRYVPHVVEQTMTVQQFDTLFARHDPHEIMGCTFSSLLSARLAHLPPTVGFVDPHTSQQCYGVLKRLGVHAARLQCGNYILSEEVRRNFRRQFRA